jgi:drug/metabolite transporter (DMT)-like permease
MKTTDPLPALRHDLNRGALYMLVSLLCFTGNAMCLRHLADLHVSPAVSLTVRFTTGLILTCLFFKPRLWASFTHGLLASRGLIGGLSTAAYYCTVGPLGVGKATLIGNTWTVFSAVFAAWMLKEKLSARKLVALLLAVAGIALLSEVSAGQLGSDGSWEAVALAGAVGAAAVVVVIRQLTRSVDSATIFGSQCVYGLLMALPFALPHLAALQAGHALVLLGAGLCASVGQLAMTEGFRFLTVTAGAAFQVLVPVTISLGGALLFAEQFSTYQIMGACLTLLGSWVAARGAARLAPRDGAAKEDAER